MENYLDGGGAEPVDGWVPLRSQLGKVEAKIADMEPAKAELEGQISGWRGKEVELEKQYLVLLGQAEQLRGAEQHKRERRLYDLRSGWDVPVVLAEGGLY